MNYKLEIFKGYKVQESEPPIESLGGAVPLGQYVELYAGGDPPRFRIGMRYYHELEPPPEPTFSEKFSRALYYIRTGRMPAIPYIGRERMDVIVNDTGLLRRRRLPDPESTLLDRLWFMGDIVNTTIDPYEQRLMEVKAGGLLIERRRIRIVFNEGINS